MRDWPWRQPLDLSWVRLLLRFLENSRIHNKNVSSNLCLSFRTSILEHIGCSNISRAPYPNWFCSAIKQLRHQKFLEITRHRRWLSIYNNENNRIAISSELLLVTKFDAQSLRNPILFKRHNSFFQIQIHLSIPILFDNSEKVICSNFCI